MIAPTGGRKDRKRNVILSVGEAEVEESPEVLQCLGNGFLDSLRSLEMTKDGTIPGKFDAWRFVYTVVRKCPRALPARRVAGEFSGGQRYTGGKGE